MLEGHQVEIVKTLKANGENAQVSYHSPTKSWIVASKNRGIMVRSRADILKQDPISSVFAMEMAQCWFDKLESLANQPKGH